MKDVSVRFGPPPYTVFEFTTRQCVWCLRKFKATVSYSEETRKIIESALKNNDGAPDILSQKEGSDDCPTCGANESIALSGTMLESCQ